MATKKIVGGSGMKKFISITVAVLMLLAALSGCTTAAPTSVATVAPTAAPTDAPTAAPTTAPADTASAAPQATADTSNPWSSLDLSKPETVNFYVVGTPGDDYQMVVDKANAIMKQKINTTVNFTIVPFSDFQSKYALYLAGDADVDCIYGAAWCNYLDNVKAGAYKPLSEEFLQKNMPLAWKNQAASSWKEATYNGQIYCVPGNRVDASSSSAVTTQDLLDSVGMKAGDVTSWDGLTTYLKKIATTKTGTGTYGVNPQGSWPSDVYWFTFKHHLFDMDAGSATWMVWDYSAGKAFSTDDLTWWAESPAYLDFALEMADYNKAGIFPSSVLQSQSFINDNFMNGKSAINFMSPSEADSNAAQLKANGKDLVYFDCCFDSQSKIRKGGYLGYGACFPVASLKTERAATALDCMKFDYDTNMLLVGGVEGTHYILDKTNNIRTLGPSANKYSWGSWFYWIQNDSNPSAKLSDNYQTINQKYKATTVDNTVFPVNGFTYNSSKYTAQLAVISSLVNEYRFSFCFGVFQDNTKAKYDEFIKKCKDAKIDEIVADYRAQLAAFISGK
jgi:putative aldouronate transport system substrate-binding protein